MNLPIYVTQPELPPLLEFLPYLEEIWSNKILTNGGPFHQQFEAALCEYLGVEHLALCSNGTLGLVTALQALSIKNEVITTPYSFVATAHSLLWNGLQPVFVDIDPLTLNIDPEKIEAAITSKTTAILAVHCYGRPCDVETIQSIAERNNLQVIYDAAHAFGVKDCGGSILRHGNLAILSFHATKVFNTFEGGAIICPDLKTKQKIDQLKNFGFIDEVTVIAPGINGKMSEFNAALGLLQLKYVDSAISKRQSIDSFYRDSLKCVSGIKCVDLLNCVENNYSYFPVIVDSEYYLSRDQLYQKLKDKNIFSRRYFYPLISDFPMYRSMLSASSENIPVAIDVSKKILCLPIYPGLKSVDLDRIIDVISCS